MQECIFKIKKRRPKVNILAGKMYTPTDKHDRFYPFLISWCQHINVAMPPILQFYVWEFIGSKSSRILSKLDGTCLTHHVRIIHRWFTWNNCCLIWLSKVSSFELTARKGIIIIGVTFLWIASKGLYHYWEHKTSAYVVQLCLVLSEICSRNISISIMMMNHT